MHGDHSVEFLFIQEEDAVLPFDLLLLHQLYLCYWLCVVKVQFVQPIYHPLFVALLDILKLPHFPTKAHISHLCNILVLALYGMLIRNSLTCFQAIV